MTRRITPKQALAALDRYLMCEARALLADHKGNNAGSASITGERYHRTANNWFNKAEAAITIVRAFIEQAANVS